MTDPRDATIASLREKVEQKDELIAELQTSIAEIDDDRLFWRGKAKTAEAALREIAESDHIENCLDPARNKRIARAALTNGGTE